MTAWQRGSLPSLLLLQDRGALPGQQGRIASDCHILVERQQLQALLRQNRWRRE